MRDLFAGLFRHMHWADIAVLDSLRQPTVTPRARAVFAHILGAEHVWLTRLRQVPPRYAVWPTLDLTQCADLAAENAAGFQAFIAAQDEATLAGETVYTNSAGQVFHSRVDDILLHVCLHGSYHRGQVTMLVRDASATPAPTDYIGFARGVPAATRTDSGVAPRPSSSDPR